MLPWLTFENPLSLCASFDCFHGSSLMCQAKLMILKH